MIDPKIIESMRQFSENYAKTTNTFFCADLEVTQSVIMGLAKKQAGLWCTFMSMSLL